MQTIILCGCLFLSMACILSQQQSAIQSDAMNMGEEDFASKQQQQPQVAASSLLLAVVAQASCQGTLAALGIIFPVYAVGRDCQDPNAGTCHQICKNKALHTQSPNQRIQQATWVAIRSFFIDPATATNSIGTLGTLANPQLGLMSEQFISVHVNGCGPNFCCCVPHVVHP